MVRKNLKFTLGFVVIVAAIAYFAISGFQEGKAYYSTLDELEQLGPGAQGKRLRVAGIVQPGSISRHGKDMTFTLQQDELTLVVEYTGSAPVPDTFKDGAEAVVQGVRRPDGSFEADHLQAKCASKYEAEYGEDAEHPEDTPMN